ncbi:MAG: PAS domain S-box protein [Gemmataceae bacterium]|nr:PAS domain S-box protein [Gemmataceae bacterium]
MTDARKSVVVYAVTLAAVAGAGAARWLFDRLLGDHLPFVFFFVATVLAAWVGGLRPALLATGLGFVLAWYLFVPPRFAFAVPAGPHAVGLAMSLMVGLAVAVFSGALRRSEAAARRHAEQTRITLGSIGDAVITTDAAGRVAYMNAVACELTGWARDDAVGRPLAAVFRIVNEQTRRPVENPVEKVRKLGQVVGLANHTVLIARDGTERPIDDSAAPIRDDRGAVTGAVLVFHDVTERRRAERLAQEQASLIQAVNDNTADLIFMKDRANRLTYANAATLRVIGMSREEAVRAGEAERFHAPEETAAIAALDRRVLDTGETVVGEEPYTCADGGRRVFLSTKTPLRDEAGRVVGVIGVSRDITDRKRAEADLRASEERFRTLFESMDEGYCVAEVEFDPAGRPTDYRIVEMNPAFEKHTGLRGVLNQSIRQAVPGLEEFWFETYGRVASTGEPTRFVNEAKPMDGRTFDVYAFRLGGPGSP